MGSVVLGKLALHWCMACNLPVLGKSCSRCNEPTLKVKHTPPGDVRPAFSRDLEKIRALVDRQFGEGCGDILLPEGNIVVLNGIPDQDRMDEVIVSGIVVGNLRFTIEHGYGFLLKPEGAERILSNLSRAWVRVDDEAVPFIVKGTSVLAPGVVDADPSIVPGDEVVVISESGMLLGPGTAKLPGTGMKDADYGLSVRLRQKWKELELPFNYDQPGTWEDAVGSSMNSLVNHQGEAVSFVKRVVDQHPDLPVMVSLSGGKDSLVVLLLVLEAGFDPTLLFLDTGLEFPETIVNVRLTAEKYGLPLVLAEAGDAFWRNVAQFGPPSKDFRWCCKVCKLGPTARTIMETYPDGVLSFIGQRTYESSQRAKKSRVWENPWVPGQVGASPIQHWTALHIWLFLFWKKAEYNPLYELGFARIGCWLCPASDQADYLEILDVHPEGERWQAFLEAYAREKGYTDEWLRYGLWKWKKPPGFVKDLMDRKGIRFRREQTCSEGSSGEGRENGSTGVDVGRVEKKYDHIGLQSGLTFLKGEISPSCTDELTVEGIFNRPLDIQRASRLLTISGLTCYDEDVGLVSIGSKLTLTREGSLSVSAATTKEVERILETALEIIIRSEECVGCGICLGRCQHSALFLNDRKMVDILTEKCVHCRTCLGKCPVTDFRDDGEFES